MAEHLPVDHKKPALNLAKAGPLNLGLYSENIDTRCDLASYETVSQLPDRLAGIWIVVLNLTHPIPRYRKDRNSAFSGHAYKPQLFGILIIL